jgi:hypothetical protein
MKMLILLTMFNSISMLIFSKSLFNFVGIGFTYFDITNKEIKVESLLKSGNWL